MLKRNHSPLKVHFAELREGGGGGGVKPSKTTFCKGGGGRSQILTKRWTC